MSQVFRSGAFAQQCFSVHPLSLAVKRVEAQERLVVSCRSCKMLHYLTFHSVGCRESAVAPQPTTQGGADALVTCVSSHPAAVSIRELDVFRDAVVLRCADCRRLYDLSIASFETHQR